MSAEMYDSKIVGPFTELEMSHIRECAAERGVSATTLIRQVVLDDLHR